MRCTIELKPLELYKSKWRSAGVDSKASVTINALWPKPRAHSRLRARPHRRMRLLGRRKKTQRLYWPYSGQTAKLQPEEKQSNSPCYKQSLLKCPRDPLFRGQDHSNAHWPEGENLPLVANGCPLLSMFSWIRLQIFSLLSALNHTISY